MISWDKISWRTFFIEEFFDVKRGNANNTTDRTIEYSKNQVAIASAKKNNNSICGFAIPKRNETIYKDILTVNNTGDGGAGYSYYHNYKVIVSSTVSVLLPKTKINPSSLKFLSVCIQNVTRPKFSFAYSASDERLLKTKILLPVDNDGKPNWSFMENYIRELEKKKINEILSHLNHTHTHTISKNVENLSCLQWRLFNVCNFFSVKRGSFFDINNKNNNCLFGVPVASARDKNNPITGFFDLRDKKVYKNKLTINNNGSIGYCFFRNYYFQCTTDVTVIIEKQNISDYCLKFIGSALQKTTLNKFSYSYKISNDRLLYNTKILLPVDKNNNPYWEYMENYIRNLENIKIKKVIDHLERKIKLNFMY
ncbi:MAG: restriction endonuclease subunit S [Mycoplasma sp.]